MEYLKMYFLWKWDIFKVPNKIARVFNGVALLFLVSMLDFGAWNGFVYGAARTCRGRGHVHPQREP